jgi:hypothetical protein
LPDFYQLLWPDAPSGTYTFFLALLRSGALADGHLDPTDTLAVATASATLTR